MLYQPNSVLPPHGRWEGPLVFSCRLLPRALAQLQALPTRHPQQAAASLLSSTSTALDECTSLCYHKDSLYFLDTTKSDCILRFASGKVSTHFQSPLPLGHMLRVDPEGGFVVGSPKGLVRVSPGKGVAEREVPWSDFYVDGEGETFVVWEGEIKKVSKGLERVVRVAGGPGRGYLDGPVGVAQFTSLVSVCCDPYGSIYVVDDYKDSAKIRMVSEGYVSTIHYSAENMQKPQAYEGHWINKMYFENDCLFGVWGESQIFVIRLSKFEIEKWPISHFRFSGRHQKIVEEVLLIGKIGLLPKDLSVLLIKMLLKVLTSGMTSRL